MMAEGYLKRGWTSPDGKPVRVDNKFNAGVEYLLQVNLINYKNLNFIHNI